MEWVEITARTVDEARELALDQLGVDEQDAEVEVLEEPRAGAVRPPAGPGPGPGPGASRPRRGRRPSGGTAEAPAARPRRRQSEPRRYDAEPDGPMQTAVAAAGRRRRRPQRRATAAAGAAERRAAAGAEREPERPSEGGTTMAGADHRRAGRGGRRRSSRGLADQFGVDGTTTTIERVEEDTVEVRLDGGDLGLLIGPKGQTLQTVQELARTVVQRRGGGTQEGRIRIDIAGYRQRRREALERFTQQVRRVGAEHRARRRRSSR